MTTIHAYGLVSLVVEDRDSTDIDRETCECKANVLIKTHRAAYSIVEGQPAAQRK
jgi:hypothetical protein